LKIIAGSFQCLLLIDKSKVAYTIPIKNPILAVFQSGTNTNKKLPA